MNFKPYLVKEKENIVKQLSRLVQIESVIDTPTKDAPFGYQNAKALEEALKIATEFDLTTKNLDYYCGYAEIGSGSQIVGVITHLDVVPAGEGWKVAPFQVTSLDGKLYGRGTSDDKGAVIASLIAMKILKESNYPLKRRIRCILGCNEETSSLGIQHYLKQEGNITVGFTPDGDFPGTNGEKGYILSQISAKTQLKQISGGTAPNAVSDFCRVVFESTHFDDHLFFEYIQDAGLSATVVQQNGDWIIEVQGVSAHASEPELGKNAISYLLVGLSLAGLRDPFLDFYKDNINVDFYGSQLGLDCTDAYGKLTLNVGTIEQVENQVKLLLDIRVPVTQKIEKIKKLLESKGTKEVKIEVLKQTASLYYPENTKFVQQLFTAYQEVTKDTLSSLVITGGGTYAKYFHNCIAFGCKFPNVDNHIHQANEYVTLEELQLQIEIYLKAMITLANEYVDQ